MNYAAHPLDDYLLPNVEDLEEIDLFDDGMEEMPGHTLQVAEEF